MNDRLQSIATGDETLRRQFRLKLAHIIDFVALPIHCLDFHIEPRVGLLTR